LGIWGTRSSVLRRSNVLVVAEIALAYGMLHLGLKRCRKNEHDHRWVESPADRSKTRDSEVVAVLDLSDAHGQA
jgi:hypothetical protein